LGCRLRYVLISCVHAHDSAVRGAGVAATIEAHEYLVESLFGDQFVFSIPDYQRPYSWGPEQAGELLQDLLTAMDQSTGDVATLEPYFLGSIVVVKEKTDPHSEVVDGQQRLTTMVLLITAIAHRLGDDGDQLQKLLYQKGLAFANKQDEPRLTLRPQDQKFFWDCVQSEGALSRLRDEAGTPLPDAQAKIRANAFLFLAKLDSMAPETVTRLIKFLLLRTYLVVVTTPNLESAFRIFSVLNERGLDLTTADILKADVLGRIDAPTRASYTKKWEDTEDDLGREPFDELLAHIRTVVVKARLRSTVVKEFRDHVVAKSTSPEELIDDVIVPNATAYGYIRGESYDIEHADDPTVRVEVNRQLRFLNLLDNFDWVPPAMSYLRKHLQEPQVVLHFLRGLDRLAWSMFIRRVDVNGRSNRYRPLLDAIEKDDAEAIETAIVLTPEDQQLTLKALDGDVYNVARIPLPVLLRLEDCKAENGLAPLPKTLSVEHVLPQTMDEGGWWIERFSKETHDAWVHRLANLVLLSRSKNSAASNLPFPEKTEKYFKAEGVTTWALTVQVIGRTDWTEQVLIDRQRESLDLLAKLWDLSPG